MSFSPAPVLSRRSLLAGAAATPAFGLAASAEGARPLAARPLTACILTPQTVEGPSYFDPNLHREDIAEGKPGVPLALRFLVIEAGDCQPVAGARVDVWHADADGLYSGINGLDHAVDTSGSTFLRGTQFANGEGEVRFCTIYPGWYPGRTAHLHFKVQLDRRNVLTGQMYFPDALSQYIYANVADYRRNTPRDTYNSTDRLARMDGGHGGFCDIREETDHYLATLILGVDRSAKVVEGMEESLSSGGPLPSGGTVSKPPSIVPGVKNG